MMLRSIAILLLTLFMGTSAQPWAASRPLVIAHRAGMADALENSLPAIDLALKNGADSIWVTIQLTKDGCPVLYRPDDLSELTTGKGLVSHHTAAQLAAVRYKNSHIKLGTNSAPTPVKSINEPVEQTANQYISRALSSANSAAKIEHTATIPTLAQVLATFTTAHFYLDLKSPDADAHRFAAAVERVIAERSTHAAQGSYHRTTIYSTNKAYIDAFKPFKRVQRMVARDITRELLVVNLLSQQCLATTLEQGLQGFEIAREVTVTERFKLGVGENKTIMRINQRAVNCLLSAPANKLILFGVNTLDDYYRASHYGAFAVMVDSPLFFKQHLPKPPLPRQSFFNLSPSNQHRAAVKRTAL